MSARCTLTLKITLLLIWNIYTTTITFTCVQKSGRPGCWLTFQYFDLWLNSQHKWRMVKLNKWITTSAMMATLKLNKYVNLRFWLKSFDWVGWPACTRPRPLSIVKIWFFPPLSAEAAADMNNQHDFWQHNWFQGRDPTNSKGKTRRSSFSCYSMVSKSQTDFLEKFCSPTEGTVVWPTSQAAADKLQCTLLFKREIFSTISIQEPFG